ncbi:MAG TPA: hypothetical protein VIY47_09495, partial [Ignavibacteriaceae bacterium]
TVPRNTSTLSFHWLNSSLSNFSKDEISTHMYICQMRQFVFAFSHSNFCDDTSLNVISIFVLK